MTEHTPGPWRLEGLAGTNYPDLTLWSVLAPNPDAGKKGVSYSGEELTVVMGMDDETDARLIAAAPDLLAALITSAEALEATAEWIEELGYHGTALGVQQDAVKTRAAIAKATE